MSSPTDFKVVEQSPASIYAGSEPQTPDDDTALSTVAAQLSFNDEESAKVKKDDSGFYFSDATTSPIKPYSPGKLYTPPFARLPGGNDDPFKSSPSPTRTHAGSLTPTGPKASRKDAIMNKDHWRQASDNSDDDESVVYSPSLQRSNNAKTARKLSFGTSDPEHSLRPDEAQGVYPPSCCVFVANLLQSEGEETLQMAVTQVFREFGPVFVKIRRDAKQMPFAFCQYTTAEHADRAIKEGRGRLIKGRACRCEKAKAHRLFFVERKFGPTATPDEVRQLLAPYGNIDFCYTASHVERTALNLNEGVIIQFQLYDDGQNAQSAFRNHDSWKLVAIAGMNSPARTMGPARSNPTAVDSARAYLSRYETDRRSIFVGNLPLGTTEDQIKELFASYGKVEEIILRESASKFEPHERLCFAFVQFEAVTAVTGILSVQGGFNFGGKTLRISQKDSENGGPRRPARPVGSSASPAPAAYQSPAQGHAQSPASPMAMAPPVYSSPFAYPYGSPYYYAPGSAYPDGQQYYQAAPAYPGYYSSYPGSPAYDAAAANTTSGTAQVSGSPTAQSYYGYGYPGYSYSPQQYWGMGASPAAAAPAQAAQQPSQFYQPPIYGASYSPPVASSSVADDRSATPTPPGQGAATPDDTLES